MAKVITDNRNYTDIANAIRSKGVDGSFKPNEMANAIECISSGGLPEVRKFSVATDPTLGTYGGISFPVITDGHANYLIMQNDASKMTASDRWLRCGVISLDYNISNKNGYGFARYDGNSNASVGTITVADGIMTVLGSTVIHMEQTYSVDIYEVMF